MRLFLLGCTGFIGRELIPRLLNSGHHLTVISRNVQPHSLRGLSSKQLQHLQIDPSKPINWENTELLEALSKANGVINLAGEPITEKRWSDQQCEIITNSRLSTTASLIKTMSGLQEMPEILVNASAIGFYGTSQDSFFTENSSCGDDFLSNLCFQWEHLAMQKPNTTRLVLLRIGIVLEADGGALGKMLPVFRSGFGGPIGNGKQWMSWIHRTDLCNIIETSLLDKSWGGVINAVAPNPCDMSTFSKTLGKALGRPSLLPIPGPLLQLLLGDGAKVVLEGQKVICERLEKMSFKFQFPELKQAIESITN
tara:strand:+ start:1331 stop:2260 length:930 start_codon:yes stop_codon:yes gene_type:complete